MLSRIPFIASDNVCYIVTFSIRFTVYLNVCFSICFIWLSLILISVDDHRRIKSYNCFIIGNLDDVDLEGNLRTGCHPFRIRDDQAYSVVANNFWTDLKHDCLSCLI